MPSGAKTRKAVLSGTYLNELFLLTLKARGIDRFTSKCIDMAEEAIKKHGEFTVTENGSVRFKVDDEEAFECEFTHQEIFGLKVAVVQGIVGSQSREGASHGAIKYSLTPICKRLGILKQVKNEANLKDSEEEEAMDLKFDDEEENEKEALDLDEKEPEGREGEKKEG